MKQETLEKAAEKLSKNAYKKHSVKDDKLSLDEQIQRSGGFIVGFKEGMIEGAKWQEERMYSEEDLRNAWYEGKKDTTECMANGKDKKCYCTNEIHCQYKRLIEFTEWFEQFKKK